MCLRYNWLIINDLMGGGNYCYKLLVKYDLMFSKKCQKMYLQLLGGGNYCYKLLVKYDLILYFCVIIGILKYLNGL